MFTCDKKNQQKNTLGDRQAVFQWPGYKGSAGV